MVKCQSKSSKRGHPPEGSTKGFKCETKYCRNKKARKTDGYLLKHCWKCRARWLKEHHPATYVINMLRASARKRKLAFTITLVEFRKFCAETGYLEHRGKKPHSLTIDRKDHDKGYHIWNIQVSTHAQNSLNGHTVPNRVTKQNERRPAPEDISDTDETGAQETVPSEDSPF